MNREGDGWEELLDDLEEERELEFDEDKKDSPSFYASRLQLIEEAAKRLKGR